MTPNAQRLTARRDQPFVVFLIGMRINRWWKIGSWLRVVLAMTRMQRELRAAPPLGMLSMEQWLSRTTMMVSYWDSMAQLMAFASKPEGTHLAAWKGYNRLLKSNGDVGIWHETYLIRPGDYENVYVNMPPFGMGKSSPLEEATGHLTRAEGRLASGNRA